MIRYLPLLLLAVAWEVVARLELVSSTALPPLSDVVAAWVDMIKDGELITNGASSLYRAGAGLALSIIVGTLLGIGMAWWKPVNVLLAPIVEIFYPLPKSALIPVTVIWLGFGDGSKILLIFLGCMLPVTIGAFNGARSSEQVLVWSARSMGASRLRMLWDVVLPSAMPELLNGIRTALALSFILLVSSELIVAQKGFGYLIGFLGANGTYDAMYAVVFSVAFLGFAADRSISSNKAGAGMARIARVKPEGLPEGGAACVSILVWRAARVVSVVALLAAWEMVARSGIVTPFQLPALSKVLDRIWSDAVSGDLCHQHGASRSIARWWLSASRPSAASSSGMAMSRNALARWFFDPIISVGFPMPKIAFLPVVILWLGVFDVSKITMIVFDAIIPCRGGNHHCYPGRRTRVDLVGPQHGRARE